MGLKTIGLAALAVAWAVSPVAAYDFVTEPFPPYQYEEGDGKVVGPTRDIIAESCALINETCNFSIMPWRKALAETQAGQFDGLFLLGKTAEREMWMNFSEPLVHAPLGFFTLDVNSTTFDDLHSLAGRDVASYGPSFFITKLEEIREKGIDFNIVQEVRFETAIDKLAFGRYGNLGVVYGDMELGSYWIREHRYSQVRDAGIHQRVAYYIGFPKMRVKPEFVDRFNHGLAQLKTTGRWAAILQRYHFKAATDR